MIIGEVKIAEDEDFEKIKSLINKQDGWKLDYNKGTTKVWTKPTEQSHFNMFKATTSFKDIPAEILYDVLLDPEYRKVWDPHMVDSYDIGFLNPNNDVGYYSVRCPSPLKNRDFVLQRSWLDTGKEYFLLSHSVFHDRSPPKKGFIRGVVHLTGYIIKPTSKSSCEFSYVTHSDPKGSFPIWVVNKLSRYVAPKMIKKLHKASLGYDLWKTKNKPGHKPWIYPEQTTLGRLNLSEMKEKEYSISYECLDESLMDESTFDEIIAEDD